jgi:O-antigen ligase
MHATYLAMQVDVALVVLLCLVIKGTNSRHRVFYLVCCAVLTAGIIQLGSRAVFIALFLIINLGVPFFLLNYSRRVRFALFIIPLSLLVIGVIYGFNNFKHRYVTELEKDLSKETTTEITDTRLARWNLALGIAAGSPVIGYGSGSEKTVLKEGYFRNKYFHSYMSDLNAHNQFISMLIKFGISGLLVFLTTLCYGFRKSIKEKDLLLFAFLFVIVIVCFSENIIDRDKGIYFYSIFYSLLIFSHLNVKTTNPVL